MVLKLSGSRYLGNSAFGGDASPHVSGLILVTQLRSGEIFPGLKNSVIINNLKYHRNDIYQKLFTDNNGEGCIDSLGFDLFDFIRHGA